MEKVHFTNSQRSNDFYQILKQRVLIKLGLNKTKTGPTLEFMIKALFWATLCWGTYFLIITNQLFGLTLILAVITVHVSGLLFGFAVGHDASHSILASSKTTNQIFHFISFLTIGIDPMLWGLRHIRSHHVFPNVQGSDIDIDENPLLRLSPVHPWKPQHRFQHIYAPLAYMLALAHSCFWGDWFYLFSSKYKWMRVGVSKITLIANFVIFKLIHLILMVVLPALLLPYSISAILVVYFACGALTSLVFIIMLVGTHFFEEADYPVPVSDTLPTSWAEHNLRTSCDWNPNSAIARFLSGGANCHAAHHLFPNICHTYYGQINEIITKTTVEFDIPYHQKNLCAMIRSHFRHLKNLAVKS